jgi:predicted glycosyltransferase
MYKGYHELAYLHPNHFEHNVEYLKEAGLSENEKFFIVRFVAWEATHDIGKKGFSADGKIKLINELAKYGRVIITSERNVPENLKKYCLAVHPAKIHHIMAFSSLYIGEGATMASEAVILGVPSIYVNPLMMGYISEQQRFGLYFLPDETDAIEKAVEIAVNPEVFKKDMIEKQKNLFSEKIDVSSWIIDRILGK